MNSKNNNPENVFQAPGSKEQDSQKFAGAIGSPVEPKTDVLADDELEEIAGGGISGDLGCGR